MNELTKDSLERLLEGEAASEATNEIERRPMNKKDVDERIEEAEVEAPEAEEAP